MKSEKCDRDKKAVCVPIAGCGTRKTVGHGEFTICGEKYFDEVWICRDCLRKLLESKASKLEKLAWNIIKTIEEADASLGYGDRTHEEDEALRELKEFLLEQRETNASQETDANVYGYCPKCSRPGIARERRINGNDRCESGHVYPSSSSKSESI